MKLRILKVKGNSMHPALKSGDFVFVLHTKYLTDPNSKLSKIAVISRIIKPLKPLEVGDIVAVNHSKYGKIIKRIKKLEYKPSSQQHPKFNSNDQQKQIARMQLCGDNKFESISEDAMGWVSEEYLMGKIIYIVKR